MSHVENREAEKILDKEFKVLDKGFVRLVDYMGGDERVVQAARVSYGKGTKTLREDKMLIDYLMRHQHTSPFEQVVLTFHCKMPIFVARQWIRHRTARVNEISGRYSILNEEFYIPETSRIGFQSRTNRQGSDENNEVPIELQEKVLRILKEGQEKAYKDYNEMIEDNIARELARINLPLSLYTQWYWQIDLHNLFHFLELRLDYHAQYEIREYAKVIAKITKVVAPISYEAFEKHVLNSVKFSGEELKALKRMLDGKEHGLTGLLKVEFEKKLEKIFNS